MFDIFCYRHTWSRIFCIPSFYWYDFIFTFFHRHVTVTRVHYLCVHLIFFYTSLSFYKVIFFFTFSSFYCAVIFLRACLLVRRWPKFCHLKVPGGLGSPAILAIYWVVVVVVLVISWHEGAVLWQLVFGEINARETFRWYCIRCLRRASNVLFCFSSFREWHKWIMTYCCGKSSSVKSTRLFLLLLTLMNTS